MFRNYSPFVVFIRRFFAAMVFLVSWPCLLVPRWRASCGSLLHRYWIKKGNQPVWMMSQDQGNKLSDETFYLG